jgi:non-canonical purine NTP pyrophosphatase (RdgB/HAM1 family)
LRQDLDPCGLGVAHVDRELTEPQSISVETVARAKCWQAFQMVDQQPVVVLDAGFHISAFENFPGALIDPFLEGLGIARILKLLETEENRRCFFRECLAYLDPELTEPQLFVSDIHGSIATTQRGELQFHHWSSLCLIFTPTGGDGRTLAETTQEEHHRWRDESLRSRSSSARQFANWFTEPRPSS